MAEDRLERRLTTILAADVVGCSRLMVAAPVQPLQTAAWASLRILQVLSRHTSGQYQYSMAIEALQRAEPGLGERRH